MKITLPTLIKIAEDTIDKRVKASSKILAVYMHGSVNEEVDHLIGDCGDLDLVFVHDYEHDIRREFQRVTDELTLDIRHHTRKTYESPRSLRSEPWLGPAVYNYRIMHDPRHFLDFVQAGLRDQFFSPRNVLTRAQYLADAARGRWIDLLQAGEGSPATALAFLEAASDAANAHASLEGDPLPERRLLTRFHERTVLNGRADLYTGYLELLGAGAMHAEDLRSWVSSWEETFQAACSETAEPAPLEWGLHLDRRRYYQGAFHDMLASERPADVLWPLLLTWTRAANTLPAGSRARTSWEQAATQIGLIGPDFSKRLEALDVFLDRTEEIRLAWGLERGRRGIGIKKDITQL